MSINTHLRYIPLLDNVVVETTAIKHSLHAYIHTHARTHSVKHFKNKQRINSVKLLQSNTSNTSHDRRTTNQQMIHWATQKATSIQTQFAQNLPHWLFLWNLSQNFLSLALSRSLSEISCCSPISLKTAERQTCSTTQLVKYFDSNSQVHEIFCFPVGFSNLLHFGLPGLKFENGISRFRTTL